MTVELDVCDELVTFELLLVELLELLVWLVLLEDELLFELECVDCDVLPDEAVQDALE